jgi:hypothetical protein
LLDELPFPKDINWDARLDFEGYAKFRQPIQPELKPIMPKWSPYKQYDGNGFRIRSTAAGSGSTEDHKHSSGVGGISNIIDKFSPKITPIEIFFDD